MLKKLIKKLNFATAIFLLGTLIFLGYMLSGFFHATDNAFVVKLITPISAKVSGNVEEIYVHNGEHVAKGSLLFRVDDESYLLAYKAAKAQYDQAKEGIEALKKHLAVTEYNTKAAENDLQLLQYQYKQKSQKTVVGAVPYMELHDLQYQINAQQNRISALNEQISAQKIEITQAKTGLMSLDSVKEQAALNLKHTKVIAPTSGVISNIFIGIGTAIRAGEALFSLVNDGTTYVQANVNETEVSGIRSGDKVDIYPRVYLGDKSFEGVVVDAHLAIDRQTKNPLTATPIVLNENKWLLLPQRIPVIIQVLNTDENYPLQSGMSAYVRIHTQ